MSIVLIGAGNLATCLGKALKQAGLSVVQVYSRTEASAARLASLLDCPYTTDLKAIDQEAFFYIFALKDQGLEAAIQQMHANHGIWVHTAGSMPMHVFEGHNPRYGVFYPLQTFSKTREVNFRQIPIFVEGSDPAVEERLQQLAKQLSEQVYVLSSEKRKYLHLAAVFACNFTNHLYALASDLLEAEAIPREVLLPLIDETAAKIHDLSPQAAQTGPAIRYDKQVIDKQLAMLTDPDLQQLYQLLSQSIHKKAKQ